MSRKLSLSTTELKAAILNQEYPDGNVAVLLEHSSLMYGGQRGDIAGGVRMIVNAPDWAYTNPEAPKRFHVSGLHVIDRVDAPERIVATCERYSDAMILCGMLNNRELREVGGSGI